MISRTSTTTAAASSRLGQPYVAAVLGLAGASMLAAGIWAGAAPRSFARFVAFPSHEHFLHDLGAFQIGIGTTLLLALAWRDAATVALAGFLVANTLHAVSHAIDLDLGGRASDPYAFGRCRCCRPPPWCCGCASVAPQRRSRTTGRRRRDEKVLPAGATGRPARRWVVACTAVMRLGMATVLPGSWLGSGMGEATALAAQTTDDG